MTNMYTYMLKKTTDMKPVDMYKMFMKNYLSSLVISEVTFCYTLPSGCICVLTLTNVLEGSMVVYTAREALLIA